MRSPQPRVWLGRDLDRDSSFSARFVSCFFYAVTHETGNRGSAGGLARAIRFDDSRGLQENAAPAPALAATSGRNRKGRITPPPVPGKRGKESLPAFKGNAFTAGRWIWGDCEGTVRVELGDAPRRAARATSAPLKLQERGEQALYLLGWLARGLQHGVTREGTAIRTLGRLNRHGGKSKMNPRRKTLERIRRKKPLFRCWCW